MPLPSLSNDQHVALVRLLERVAAAPEGEHRAFVDADPHPEVRRAARFLLDQVDDPTTIDSWADFAKSFEDDLDDDPAPTPPEGYELLRRLGRGGAGEVWHARQHRPVRREVAVKFLRPRWSNSDADATGVLRRFGAEREALARLDHPHVARVLDAGTTPDGRPFVAISLVAGGQPVTQFAQARGLDVPTRLRLVIAACRAVQHAHTRGLIHRDLKPANLLARDGEQGPEVVVIDFGIAKALADGPDGSDAAADRTLQGQRFGTPHYMAPEQWRDASDADVRADVFALGVVLYELLAGTKPFDGRGEPRSDASPGSSHRPTLPRELDWVTGRALRLDRADRYASAADLGDDLERFLDGRPLAAAPDSRVYRLRKFVRRNTAAAVLSAAVLLTVVCGSALATWQAVRATGAERLAERRQIEAESRAAEAEAARVESDAAGRRSELARVQSDAARTFFYEMLLAAAPEQARGRDVTVAELATRAAERLAQSPPDEPVVQAELHDALGNVLHGLGRRDEARDHFARAFESYMSALGPTDLRTLQARGSHAAMVMLAGDNGRAGDLMRALLADIDVLTSGPGEIDATLRDLLIVTGNNYASLLKRQGDYAGALPVQRTLARQAAGAFGPDHPNTLTSLNNLASTLRWLREYDEARATFDVVLEGRRRVLGEDHPHTLQALSNLASLEDSRGNFAESEPLLREVVGARTRLLGGEHPDTLVSKSSLAMTLQGMGRFDEATPLLEECLSARTRLLGDGHPDTLKSLSDYGGVLCKLGRHDEGLPMIRDAVARMNAGDANEAIRTDAVSRLGMYLHDAGLDDEAVAVLDEIVRLDTLSSLDPQTAARAYHVLGEIAHKRGDAAAADAWEARRSDVARRLASR